MLGLKGKIRECYVELEKMRGGTAKKEDVPLALQGQKDVSITQYLSAKYPAGCNKEGTFEMERLYAELGINPDTMTVANLIDLDQDSRWLVPEIFRDAIRKGIRTSPFYNQLTAAAESIAQPQYNMPYLDLSDAEAKVTGEGETISKGSISYGNKVVNITKKAIGIEISYEAIQYSTLNLLSIYLQDIGVKLGHKLNNDCVNILVNGDQAGGSESAPTVGIKVPGTLDYEDILHVWIRGTRLGRLYNRFVTSEKVAQAIMMLPEFKEKQAGTPQQSLALNGVLPSQSIIFISSQLTDTQFLMIDPSFALVQLTSAPLNVEGEKLVSKQIQGSYASITTGFANIFRDARVLVDTTLDVASNDFPAYMTPSI